MTKASKTARGFTLIEVMATLAILSIALVVLIKAQTQSVNNVRRISVYERGVFVTENQLLWTILELNDVENWEELADMPVEDGIYYCNVTVSPVEMDSGEDLQATMLRIVATTTWPEGRGQSEFQLETMYLWAEANQ